MSSNNNNNSRLGRLQKATSHYTPLHWVVVVIVAILLIVILYQILKYALKGKSSDGSVQLIGAPVNSWEANKKFHNINESSDGLEFTYSYWMYIGSWNYRYGEFKNIFYKGDSENPESGFAPAMWLYPKTNSLHARISTYADPNAGCDINNIPLQKWVHVAYILNNRTVDIYIDGKLERSCVLRSPPKLNNGPIEISSDSTAGTGESGVKNYAGFYGQLSKFNYYNKALTPVEVSELYGDGPFMDPSYKVSFFRKGNLMNIEDRSGEYKIQK